MKPTLTEGLLPYTTLGPSSTWL